MVAQFWAAHKSNTRVLDFGGVLRASGFLDAVTYDPMVPEHAGRPDGKFDLVTCFETLEHVPDPVASIGAIVDYVAEPGAVFYSTLTQPDDLKDKGMSWWYVGPRNGHISLFSRQALELAWGRHGFKTFSFNASHHLAFRTLPDAWRMTIT